MQKLRVRFAALATALACAGLAWGCGDNRIAGPGEFGGTWSLSDSTGTVVLVITNDSIIEYDLDAIADCYERTSYEVIEIDGRTFRLGTVGDTLRVEMHADGDRLTVVVGNIETRYERASIDPATLPLCPPPSVSAVCTEQMALDADSVTTGTIEGSDEFNPDGTHYDLFRIELATDAALRVRMSAGFDSFLILFDSTGTLVTQNDDLSNRTLDAEIAGTFGAGCYMLMATTAFADVFGDYRIEQRRP